MTRYLVLISTSILVAACGGENTSPAEAGQVAEPAEMRAVTPAVAPPPGVGYTAFTGARIWDGTGSAVQENKSLVIRDGRVVGIYDAIPEGSQIIDLGGSWVVPGFINTHGHVSGRWADDAVANSLDRIRGDLALYAHYGVTSVISLGGAPGEAFEVRDDQETADLDHARVKLAGAVVVGDTAEEANAMVRKNINDQVDWIKLRVDDNLGNAEKMPWEAIKAAINTARVAELPVATHIFYLDDATELLQMGVRLIAHSVRDQPVSGDFAQAMIASRACYVPTLAREVTTFVYAERPAFFDDPFFLEAAKQSEIDRVSETEFMTRVAASPASAAYKVALKQAQENLKVLADAGVPISFGTDTGPAGRFLGFYEHMEFDLMAEAGMTPEQVLLSATSVAADCALLDDVGSLEAGKWADFVVLGNNPLQDISATRSIKDVYIAGNKIER